MPAIIIGFSSCGDNKTKDPTPAAKTLNKTSLTNNKIWWNRGSGIRHEFKSNGQYKTTGTWRWINNSDSMEIVGSTGSTPFKYRFIWNSETELECERMLASGRGNGLFIMKTSEWQ